VLPAFIGEAAIRKGRVVFLREITSVAGLGWPEIVCIPRSPDSPKQTSRLSIRGVKSSDS
jgi:hypothetical protein